MHAWLRAYQLRILLKEVGDVLTLERCEGCLSQRCGGTETLELAQFAFVHLGAVRASSHDPATEAQALRAHPSAMDLDDPLHRFDFLKLVLFNCLGLTVGEFAGKTFAVKNWLLLFLG